ncbi:FAD-binding protein [Gordonia terrae]|uniref:FAD-binding protein n=2 Tax=Gordonia terrae TaxID=2055 RepID=A0AAD0NX90_9ACTN|nr:FAD-binding protein [Gordonia terrae]VTR09627.1 flavocytochrome c [Clostridioides difficile]ANY22236.1 3-ketosteroid-delta-1-dehydrogenase [Gordonia terrae]AWO82975.1 FAD-binding protein [Gordonia terrae]VTS30282.1 3-oxosteroid 1-dehydrogenase [Gordonia terrae]GAB46293.1 3-ketosteroid delta(1)-dehydrogenase [Gordonia terrae NBRC 100016]
MDWNEEVDVVVAGSGGVLAGAYTAAREGLEVAVFEASDKFGGTTAYSGGGMWFPCNPVLKRAGVEDSVEDALAYYRAVVGDRTPADLQEAFVRGGAPLVEYLEKDELIQFELLPWPDYYGKAPKAKLDGMRHMTAAPLTAAEASAVRPSLRPPLDTDRLGAPLPDTLIGGQALIARLLMAISAHPNASLHPNSTLTRLIVEDGTVTGAVIEREGQSISVRARRGVVLGTGGFEADDNARAEFGVPGSARDTMGVPTNTGLGHRAAMAAGADVDLMDQAWWSPGITHPDGRSTFSLLLTGGIFVDRNGERFVNESGPYDRIGRKVLEARKVGNLGLPFWLIYDNRAGDIPPMMSTSVTMTDSSAFQTAGLRHTADTLEELAVAIGVPADKLVASVSRYNEFVTGGSDPDHGRGDEAFDRAVFGGESPLVPISDGPFHAAALGLSDLGTKGGIRTDVAGRALDRKGEPIAGLYASGNTMAAPSGETYPAGGNPIATSMLFSHLAVLDMARGTRRSDES